MFNLSEVDPMVYRVFAYMGACFLVDWTSTFLYKRYSGMQDEDLCRRINNRSVSITHSIVMFMAAVYYWQYVNTTFTIRYSPSDINAYEGIVNDIMTGYLIYDIHHEAFLETKKDYLTITHHIIGLLSHQAARWMVCGPCTFYHMLVYLAEASTPFLHTSWIMNALGMADNNMVFTLVGFCLLGNFLVFRIMLGPYILYEMYSNRALFETTTECQVQFWPNIVVLVMFNCINVVWFRKLIGMAIESLTGSKAKAKVEMKKTK
jgi:hypothetical protein